MALGQEISVDQVLSISADEIRRMLCENKVTVIKAAGYDPQRYSALMRRLGSPVRHVLDQFALPSHREILVISNLYRKGKPVGVHEGGAYWHTDMSYNYENSVFTSLMSVQVPVRGGETGFLDCEAGLQALLRLEGVARLRRVLRGIDPESASVLHCFGNRERLRDREAHAQKLEGDQEAAMHRVVRHPLILRHPVTGKKALYAVAATSILVEGLGKQESQAALDELFDLLLAHAPRYVHRYTRGDIVVWDNLSTLHCGPEIEGTHERRRCRMLYRMNVNYLNQAH